MPQVGERNRHRVKLTPKEAAALKSFT
jgi:hypothetical protein